MLRSVIPCIWLFGFLDFASHSLPQRCPPLSPLLPFRQSWLHLYWEVCHLSMSRDRLGEYWAQISGPSSETGLRYAVFRDSQVKLGRINRIREKWIWKCAITSDAKGIGRSWRDEGYTSRRRRKQRAAEGAVRKSGTWQQQWGPLGGDWMGKFDRPGVYQSRRWYQRHRTVSVSRLNGRVATVWLVCLGSTG